MESLEQVKAIFDKYKVVITAPAPEGTSQPAKEGEEVEQPADVVVEEFLPHCLVTRAFWDLKLNPVFSELNTSLKDADTEAQGKIDIEGFKTMYLLAYREYSSNPQKAMRSFLQLDKNGDGNIQKEEFMEALKVDSSGDHLTAEEFASFWRSLDADRNGMICPAEFVAAMVPGMTAQELDEMLNAYGLEPNGGHFAPSEKVEVN